MTPRVVLFDIDGTLISCGGAGRAAMSAAVANHTGRDDLLGFRFGGLTDRRIVRTALEAAGRAPEAAEIEAVIDAYLQELPRALERSEGYEVYAGVRALLDELGGRGHIAIGLGTGNVREGARQKLSVGELWQRFAFGGFGSDHEVRAEILRVGAQRGRAHLARAADQGAGVTVVIGDTPHDVSAAHAIGATCVAVATGGYSGGELSEAGAELVVDELSDALVLDYLLG